MIGTALSEIAADPDVASALFDILETQRILEAGPRVTLVPEGPRGRGITSLLAAQAGPVVPARPAAAPPPPPAEVMEEQ
jgi:hypothetical protein